MSSMPGMTIPARQITTIPRPTRLQTCSARPWLWPTSNLSKLHEKAPAHRPTTGVSADPCRRLAGHPTHGLGRVAGPQSKATRHTIRDHRKRPSIQGRPPAGGNTHRDQRYRVVNEHRHTQNQSQAMLCHGCLGSRGATHHRWCGDGDLGRCHRPKIWRKQRRSIEATHKRRCKANRIWPPVEMNAHTANTQICE